MAPLTLRSFGQEVDLSNQQVVKYYLVFDSGSGVLQLPVLSETVNALSDFLYGAPEKEKEAEPRNGNGEGLEEPTPEEGATEFGGDVETTDEVEEQEDLNEEDLPSL